MEENNITVRQGNRILFIELFSGSALLLPGQLFSYASGTEFVVLIETLLLTGLFVWLACQWTQKISYQEIISQSLPLKLLYQVRFFTAGLFFYCYLMELTETFLLPGTKRFWMAVPLVLLTWQINRGGMRLRAKTAEGLFWVFIIPAVIVIVLNIGTIPWNAFKINHFRGNAGLFMVLSVFYPAELFLFYAEKMKHCKIEKRAALGFSAMAVTLYVTAFWYGRERYPVIAMAQGTAVPGGVASRLDVFITAFWMIGLFFVFSGYLFYGSRMGQRNQTGTTAGWWWLAVLFVLSGQTGKIMGFFNEYLPGFLMVNLILGWGVPLIIYLGRR